jgi:hypothetical protein
MTDVIDGVEPGHVLFLQEKRGMALAFRKNRNKHIRACYLGSARGLDMHKGALHNTLEGRRRLGFLDMRDDQLIELLVDEAGERLFQNFEINAAGAHDGGGILLIDQREKKMLKRRVLMAALGCELQRAPQ